MRKKLDIAIATSEIVPYSKVGGLADVMGALSDELDKIGCRVTIFTPLYSSIDRKRYGIKREKGLNPQGVTVGRSLKSFRLFSTVKPDTNIKIYFIENEHYYGREGIYTEPETGKAFKDEDARTIFFNKAVIAAINAAGLKPDVVHCNDFHTGLIPAYISLGIEGGGLLEGTGTVFSIHNIAYQGSFEKDFLAKAGFDPSMFYPMSPFEYWGKINVLKIAISYAGIISTVSETYAEEIASSDEYGYGMEGLLSSRKRDIVGILNGIDNDTWDPSTDVLLPFSYSATDLSGKANNRNRLLKKFGIKAGKRTPVIGIVSRLVDQKGFDILAEAFDDLMELDLTLVILGTGQQSYHELYGDLAARYPGRLGLKLEFNNGLAHLVEAGSDFFLMPSRYEPCGLNQMYSLRYGTIPIVRETGGLKDTIDNLTKKAGRGNGFTFREYSPGALIAAIERAVDFFKDPDTVDRVRRRIMKQDHSWLKSAKKYRKLYGLAVGKAGMELTRL